MDIARSKEDETRGASQPLTPDELKSLRRLYRSLLAEPGLAEEIDVAALRREMTEAAGRGGYPTGRSGGSSLIHCMATALELCRSVAPSPTMVQAILLQPAVHYGGLTLEDVRSRWGDDTAMLVEGRSRVATLYGESKQAAVKSAENFRDLLLTFARDIRVIIIMTVDRLVLMRAINHHPNQAFVADVAAETSYLYAPLAHRLGLYRIKSELEDLAMKYTHRQIYDRIARALNAKKVERDAYIKAFIEPVKQRLEAAGLKFDIKGRTKSISSIWNKLQKQKIDVKDVYDLFAIRIILDSPAEREKADCWNAYSIVADMYTPNPSRLKDWLSIPKSNGYESLHTTVQGPGGKWVEVQIRTRRMDLVAEKGLAAHWRYKGVGGGDSGLARWMNNIRDILESGAGPGELMRDMTAAPASESEVFVFTPKGDLFKLPAGATVLDLAFAIHSGLGCNCTGAIIGGAPRKFNHKLENGDTVAILTDPRQQPKRDWLQYAVTSKARAKIRQSLKEREKKAAEYGRELLMRRARNRKVEIDEADMAKLVKQMGYKQITDFFAALGTEQLDPGRVLSEYDRMLEARQATAGQRVSAGEFQLARGADSGLSAEDGEDAPQASDVLVIGEGVSGMDYKLARCCNPIYGDKVFGFVSSVGSVKIHREDCPNAADIRSRYPYRLIPVRWSGKAGSQMGAVIAVEGRDDIGIVTNITSIVNKEPDASLRNIRVDADTSAGTFRGQLIVGVANPEALASLLRKLRTVKGVSSVARV